MLKITGNIKAILADKNTPDEIIFSGNEFLVLGLCKAFFKDEFATGYGLEGCYFYITGTDHELSILTKKIANQFNSQIQILGD